MAGTLEAGIFPAGILSRLVMNNLGAWLTRSVGCAIGVLCSCSLGVFAQEAPSPVQQRVVALPDDTVKVFKLSDLCFEYRRKDVDSALWFGTKALELARALRFHKGEAQALNDLAIIHIDLSAFAEADSALHRALAIRKALHDDAGVGAVHNKLGNLYQAQLRLEEALAENRNALRIFERIGPPAKEALILSNIAILHFNLRQYEQALTDHRAAAEVRSAIGDSTGLAESEGNMANVLAALGDTAAALGAFKRAGDYFRSHELWREYAVQAQNEAGLRLAMGDAHKALALYAEALSIREKAADRKAIASSLTGLADASLALGRMNEALRTALRAMHMGRAVGATNELMQSYKLLARIHAQLDHADSTLFYHEHYASLRDSVFSADMGQRLADLQVRFGMERKEHVLQQQRADLGVKNLEIAELGRKAERRNFLLALTVGASGALGLIALSILQYQRRKARSAKDAAVIAEREAGLRAIVENTDSERQRIAADLHDGVGQLLTGLQYRIEAAAHGNERWTAMRSMAEEASREVRDIAHRMMPRSLGEHGLVPALSDMIGRSLTLPGMSHSFEHFGVEGRLPKNLETGVYRIAQELVNNIIKHARAQQVHVQLLRNKGALILIVEDDGVGFDPVATRNGLGMRNLHDRARVIHGQLEVERGKEKGTVATLRVPLIENSVR
ncbi:MAG: tetratricopeptide repeat protein [Flavobacteriales bacterium]|nr:tetratricopeptide repeat protein [Flavobacteriales bacterium]